MFQYMRKGTMPDVVQEDGDLGGGIFFIADGHPFEPELVERKGHQVIGSQCVMKAGMDRSRIYIMRQTQLFDSLKPLQEGMFDEFQQNSGGYGNKPVHWIVEYLYKGQKKAVCW